MTELITLDPNLQYSLYQSSMSVTHHDQVHPLALVCLQTCLLASLTLTLAL